jgi:formate-dependent nitrite reductase membrane component NrfD
MDEQGGGHDPDDAPIRTASAHDTVAPREGWAGPTYYGRSQLKPAPFANWVVGGYVFLAGLSGASALLAAIADLTQGDRVARLVRRGRYLSVLAPTIGSALLVYDLHTPKRFYNMFRIAKRTSPMSIGTWILTAFSGFALSGAAAQFAADRWPRRLGWLRRAARGTQVPAAVAGIGLSTYTSALLSSTSTPLWAAAPRAQAVRFGASSVAAAAAAVSIGERHEDTRRTLDVIILAALAAELAATGASHARYQEAGVAAALDGGWGAVEKLGATLVGAAVPAGLLVASGVVARRPGLLSSAGAVAAIAGSLLLRVSIMEAGDRSASDPNISFRFSQPRNLPRRRRS